MAGIDVKLAVEQDPYAAATYSFNHPTTKVIVSDIKELRIVTVPKKGESSILFGGPPCQGFSTSNQRNRDRKNQANWLFEEFIRVVKLWKPDWVVFENVKGIIETEKGVFKEKVIQSLKDAGYITSSGILCASDFGTPQKRSRFFLIGSRHGISIEMPRPTQRKPITVKQGIDDLPKLRNGANVNFLPYSHTARSKYAKSMRNGKKGCTNHLVTKNAPHILKRYSHIPQDGNWENIPKKLMGNYTDVSRCHTGIYRRLSEIKPSVVIGNYRKNMLIHTIQNRGLSVREAARLQSFPDWYEFKGSIGFQQQQVGNAVPPFLAKAVFENIMEYDSDTKNKKQSLKRAFQIA